MMTHSVVCFDQPLPPLCSSNNGNLGEFKATYNQIFSILFMAGRTGWVRARTTLVLWTVVFEEKLEPCLRLRKEINKSPL